MNPEHFLMTAAKAIEAKRPARKGLYTLYYNFGEPIVRHASDECPPGIILATLTSKDVNQGLTQARWNLIRDRYAITAGRLET